jgi:hypothetical protein
VRWQRLFDDLEAQLRAAESAEHDANAREHVAVEQGRRSLVSRLAVGACPVDLVLADGMQLRAPVVEHGQGWLMLADGPTEVLVLADAITCASGPVRAGTDRPSRLGLRTVLRGLARRRCYVQAGLTSGRPLGGTIDGAGADHVELALHDADVPRRAAEVRSVVLVPFRALCWLRYEER